MLRVHGTTDRPDAALLALDPDLDALVDPGVVAALDHALCKPSCLRLSGQQAKDTIALVGTISRFFRSIFSFLGSRSGQEDRVAAYVVREHDRGRTLTDILDDPYVRNRCSPAEIARVLDRPDVLKAIGDDMARAAKASVQGPA
jgi:hypothetical protein